MTRAGDSSLQYCVPPMPPGILSDVGPSTREVTTRHVPLSTTDSASFTKSGPLKEGSSASRHRGLPRLWNRSRVCAPGESDPLAAKSCSAAAMAAAAAAECVRLGGCGKKLNFFGRFWMF